MKSWLLSLGSIALGGALLFATGCTKDPEQYTVIFRQNGEDDVVYKVDAGSDITELPTPKAVTGYTVTWEKTTIENVTDDLTINAVVTPNEYTITYTAEEGVTLDAYTQTVTYDAQYELKTPTKEGYSFDGWYNGTTLVASTGVWKIASNVTLTAGWTENGGAEEPEQYTVTFKQAGEADVVFTVDAGSGITELPTPKAVTGYTVTWDKTTIENVTENLVVNAVATPNTYTITYAEDGTTQTVTYDAEYALKTPTKEGYSFDGWYNGTTLVAPTGVWKIAGNVTLTAGWTENGGAEEPEQYTVTFKQAGEADVVYTVEAGSDMTELPTPKDVTGYTVTWDKTTIENVTENIVVNAVATPNTYTITYAEDGTTLTVTYDAQYELKTPTKDLHQFNGWYNGTTLVEQSGVWKTASDVTLTANWSKNTYTVTFKQAGEADVVYTVEAGSDMTELPTPKDVTGYTVAWDRTTFENITENIVVNAVATPNKYTITYVLARDETMEGDPTQDVVFGDSYTLKVPTKEGATFAYWKTADGTAVEKTGDQWKIAENVTLTAEWTSGITVTFVYLDGTTVEVNAETGSELAAEKIPALTPVVGYVVSWSVSDWFLTGSMTVTEVREAKEYQITYQSAEGVTNPTTNPTTIKYDESYTLKDATHSNSNMVFAYWKNAETGEKFKSNGVWAIDGDVELVAVFVDANNPNDWTGNH